MAVTFITGNLKDRLMMIKMMMNCFCGMVDRQMAFSLICSQAHCQVSSPSQIYDTPHRTWVQA